MAKLAEVVNEQCEPLQIPYQEASEGVPAL